jgi:hypothetical protein
MALKKKEKSQNATITVEVPIGSDLPSRIKKISEQTGLDTLNLFQKWVLQEESLIGLMRPSGSQATEQPSTPAVAVSEEAPATRKLIETEEIDPDSPDYRKILIKIVKKLKKEGMTLVKIADIFNNEKVQTVSGKGKWYSSSVINLLNSKA